MSGPLKFDGHDNAIIGLADVWDNSGGRFPRLVYDAAKIIENLMYGDLTEEERATAGAMGCPCMTYEEAVEFMEFNMEGAYVGTGTPIISWPKTAEEIADIDFGD